MTIAAILRDKGDEIVTVSPQTSLRELIDILTEKRIGAVPVTEGGAVSGIMSERDVIQSLKRLGPAALDRPVREMMTAPPITVDLETSLLAGLSLMTRRRIRHLPVMHEERMVGFVSIGDLVKARIDRIESEAEAMRAYIAG
ncbi:CBS domain-containing protein [Sphingomonas sp. BIUV-7]|uniref:CBS domain-containing protein n=1 Tax=Sphingomonas natans TaxID=3063330 RepID=A0ABT8YBY8_9SPHN|nr:CBS domain-containing protein [Sphingomonas sp. BIUV-7]MDO6415846.1 CBS domain-containing protein [Sphingomonas sp. BIUV-7]